MASINDLAAAATIASSAVALQSPASEPPAPSSPPPPASPSPSHAPVAKPTASAAPAVQENTGPAQAPPPQPEPAAAAAVSTSSATTTTTTTTTMTTTTPPPPASAVLAAPQISPPDAGSAQFPVLAPAVAPAAADGAASGVASVIPDGPAGGDGAKKPVRGAFVVFEGMDRAGKTTQAKLLQQRCIEEGKEVRFMRFPDRTTPIGQMIDAYLRGQAEIEDHVIHLLFSANRWEALKTIQTTLAAGISIICDRYYHSGIVYSAAKQNPALPLSWAKAPEVGLPRPDLVLFLDLDERVARERGGWGGEVYEKGEMQRRVRELFWGLSMGDLGGSGSRERERRAASAPDGAAAASGPGPTGGAAKNAEFRQEEEDLHIIDADLPVEELADKVWAHVLPRLEAVERGDAGMAVRTVH